MKKCFVIPFFLWVYFLSCSTAQSTKQMLISEMHSSHAVRQHWSGTVVVERMLYTMEHEGLPSAEATERAMKDVSGPMIATTLVFLAIFVPVAMMGGITGEIYKQFGVTMSFAQRS